VEQDSWSDDEHRAFWRVLLPLWPRPPRTQLTRERLEMLAFYLNERGLSRNEVAQVLSKEPDTLRRNHYFERGLIGEVSLTFRLSSVSDPIFYPGAEPYLFEGVDRLPRVQDTEPRGQDEPRNPRVAVVDPPPPTQTIRWAFQSAHRACPHTAEIIVPGSQLKTHPLRVDVYRPSCPIADRLGIDPSPGQAWEWEEDWVYRCPSWRAARARWRLARSQVLAGRRPTSSTRRMARWCARCGCRVRTSRP